MGAHPYWYFVKYQSNLQKALDELRDREFKAGRYNPESLTLGDQITDAGLNNSKMSRT